MEFEGISATKLKEISDGMNLQIDTYPSKRHGPMCTREKGYYSSSSSGYGTTDDTCFCGYYYCYGYNCGSSSSGGCGGSRSKRRGGSSSNCNDSGGGGGEAILLLIVIIIVIALIIILFPYIASATLIAIDIGIAVAIALFDIVTFGVFRTRFYRTTVNFQTIMKSDQEKEFVRHAVANGGLPRDYLPEYNTRGFSIFRIGAYLFVPSMVGTILIFFFKPGNRWVYWTPVVAFVLSILLIIVGTWIIRMRTDAVSKAY
ncbi:MAG: hypothetical protein HeimC3_19650 [Candidatus Heimdallarchaeota archaeon LC_3]|nr:MAG: hypothetical protein HeimC3_19650 [Candidatus Heimdallarchaeota archaeon LC_3]